MKIGIIGSGNMGRSLGVRFAKVGHQVFFGARRAETAEAAAQLAGEGARAGTNDEAAAFADVLLWTIRSDDPTEVLTDPSLLNDKVVIDLNNRNYADDVKNGAWFDTAIGEMLQRNAPDAKVVKAFNTIAMEAFDTTPEKLREAGAQVFLAGNDADAKEAVARIAHDIGFGSVDLGSGAAAMRAAEALGDVIRLLIIDGGHGGRAHLGFSMLPEPDLDTIGTRQESSYR